MSQSIISLEDYIYRSIWAYPSLYLRNTIRESRGAVLRHLFLTIGNGIEYNPELKNFNNNNYTRLPQNVADRIKAGEKIVEVCKGYHKQAIYFYNDFIQSDNKHLLDVKTPTVWRLIETLVKATVYPDGHYRYVQLLKKNAQRENNSDDTDFKRPYPYSLEYVPMWDRAAKKLIDKNLILSDWREGIVEIYTWAKEWMESEKFDKNDYFNWTLSLGKQGGQDFINNQWAKRKSMKQLCKDYGIPYAHYQTPEDFVKVVVAKSRKRYIDTAQLIIDTYK
jgi:hypothetical protein